jgi:hypothetical protein
MFCNTPSTGRHWAPRAITFIQQVENHLAGAVLTSEGFHQWGYPNSWMGDNGKSMKIQSTNG